MSIRRYWSVCAVLAAASAGCDVNRYVTPERLDRGLTLVVPGVGGVDPNVHALLDGLADGGTGQAVQVFDWSSPIPLANWWVNLADYGRNRRKARELAGIIADYRAGHPGRPINIVGHSAGAGMAAFALEESASDVKIDNLVLLSAALSHDYDLSAAMAHVSGRVASFHSDIDPVVSWGTRMFGSVDRKFCCCGGCGGFDLATDAAPAARAAFARLEQIPWSSEMVSYGNFGGHLGTFARPFVVKWVTPILMTRPDSVAGRGPGT